MTGPHHVDDDQAERDTQRPSLRELATDEGGRVLPGRISRVTLVDGTSFEVRISNREFVAWDMTRPKRKWPPLDEAPFLGATFMSHRAALREGKTDLSWDAWQDQVEMLENVTADEDEDDEGRPTQ